MNTCSEVSSLPSPTIFIQLPVDKFCGERFGTGLKRIADECKNADIEYEFVKNAFGFKVIFYRKPIHEQSKVVEKVVEDKHPIKITSKENEILQLLHDNPYTTTTEMSEKLGVTQQAVSKRIASLRKKELLDREGTDKNGKWVIIKKGSA